MAARIEQCRSCGGPLAPKQGFCLECGAKIIRPSGVPHSLGVAWTSRVRWYPGDWIWPSLAALVLAACGAAAAVAASHGEKTSAPSTVVALSRLVPAPTKAVEEPKPIPEPTTPGKTTRAPRPKPTVISWPDRNGYTIVLASIPLDGGATEARKRAGDALAKGLPEVGILVSSRFSSLHPGYYVVFSGVYGSLGDAQGGLSAVSSKFRQAYTREISR